MSRLASGGGVWWLLLPALIVLVGPLAWPTDPLAQELVERLEGPTARHPLGTDNLGRDLLARVLHGGRVTLGLSLMVTALTAIIGVALGLFAATVRGPADRVLAVAIDVLNAFPYLLLAITVAGLAGGGTRGLTLALLVPAWVPFARVARAEAIRLGVSPMIEAATSLGATRLRVNVRHVLPNAAPPLVTLAVLRFSHTFLTIAGLSFLGVGIAPPAPEWGAMLRAGMPFVERAPFAVLAPGLAIFSTAVFVALGADRLRRAQPR